MKYQKMTYQTTPSKDGNGTFFFTDCGHRMYSVNNEMAYHKCLCPACFMNNIMTTLYARGSEEANEIIREKGAKIIVIDE